MDDISLRHSVTDAIEHLPLINAADIGVAVCDGVVTLTGYVKNAAHKMLIEFAVLKLDGVRALAQVIEVCEDCEFLNSDEEIAKRVVRMIGWNTSISDGVLRVRVEKGWVTVTGTVLSKEQSDRVANVVRRARGVVGVSDLLEVGREPLPFVERRCERASSGAQIDHAFINNVIALSAATDADAAVDA